MLIYPQYPHFCFQLRLLRQERKLTQKALAAHANVKPRLIYLLEHDLYRPWLEYEVMLALAECLQVSPSELIWAREADDPSHTEKNREG